MIARNRLGVRAARGRGLLVPPSVTSGMRLLPAFDERAERVHEAQGTKALVMTQANGRIPARVKARETIRTRVNSGSRSRGSRCFVRATVNPLLAGHTPAGPGQSQRFCLLPPFSHDETTTSAVRLSASPCGTMFALVLNRKHAVTTLACKEKRVRRFSGKKS
jgi:hypothetical protein